MWQDRPSRRVDATRIRELVLYDTGQMYNVVVRTLTLDAITNTAPKVYTRDEQGGGAGQIE